MKHTKEIKVMKAIPMQAMTHHQPEYEAVHDARIELMEMAVLENAQGWQSGEESIPSLITDPIDMSLTVVVTMQMYKED